MRYPQRQRQNNAHQLPANVMRQVNRMEGRLTETLISQDILEEEYADESLEVRGLTEHERRVLIGEALARLSRIQHECLRLAVKHRLAPTAIGRRLEIAPSTAKVHLERALTKLQDVLADDIKIPDLWGWQGTLSGSSLMGGHCSDRPFDRGREKLSTRLEETKMPAENREMAKCGSREEVATR